MLGSCLPCRCTRRCAAPAASAGTAQCTAPHTPFTHPHTPSLTFTHPHTPSLTLTHPHTPLHALTHPPHTLTRPHTPLPTLTHPHTPSLTLTHPHTPSHAPLALTHPTCPRTPSRCLRSIASRGTTPCSAQCGSRPSSSCTLPSWVTAPSRTAQYPRQRASPALAGSPHPSPPHPPPHPTAPHRPLTTTQAPVSSPLSASARLCCESGASRRGTLAARRALPPSPPSSTWASRARACWGTCMRTRRAQHGRARRAGGGSLGHRRPEALSPSRTPALWAPELHLGRLGPALQPKAPPPKSLIPPRLTHPGGVAREAEFEAPHQLGRAAAGAAGAARAAQQLRRSAAAMHEHRRGWPHTEAQLAPPLTRANATRRGSRGACTVATLPREPPLELPLPREWRDFGGSPRRLHRRPRARESAQHRARHGVS